ncbi:MAG: 50S ribosomal protein L13 [Candidatus Omnitrophica bacterium]|nr:50S ribosomal protein L13 [Candidatus Omnitrophota bacterium]
MKTYMVKEKELKKKWILIDAQGKILGRLATRIATVLLGKHKSSYSPHQNCGDYVIVINAKDIKVTGKKESQKVYRHYTGYPGGLKEYSFKRLMERKPEEIIRLAVKRMLPHNNLRDHRLKNLKIYANSKHNHQAQQPVEMKIK